jgi:hypothetical protein
MPMYAIFSAYCRSFSTLERHSSADMGRVVCVTSRGFCRFGREQPRRRTQWSPRRRSLRARRCGLPC